MPAAPKVILQLLPSYLRTLHGGQCRRTCSEVWGPILGHAWHLSVLHGGYSAVGRVQGFGVRFLAMSGISDRCMFASVVECVQGFGAGFHTDIRL